MPRSLVINRKPVKDILLSFSLEPAAAAAQPRVRWSSDRDASFTRVCPARACSCEYVCLCGCGRLGRSLQTALGKEREEGEMLFLVADPSNTKSALMNKHGRQCDIYDF